ncbi:MAG: YheU family protein [Gammaproteobacteria bacterium]
MEIPWTSLSPAALTGLVEAFVLQEGTDYGHSEYSLEEKVASVRTQLSSGKAYISFDPDTETAVIKPRES